MLAHSASSVQLPISIDFEARLVSQAEPIPPPVCLSICYSLEDEQDLLHAKDPACKRMVRDLVEGAASGKRKLCGFYSAFDMSVIAVHFKMMDEVFAAYAAEGVHCEMIRQKLIDIAKGELGGYRNGYTGAWVDHKYNLNDVGTRHGIETHDKDTWRLRYAELEDVPIDDWELEAIQYPLDDTAKDWAIHESQLEYSQFLDDEFRQAETSFGLALMSAHGVCTDARMVEAFRRATQARIDSCRDLLVNSKYLTWQPKKEKFKKEVKKIREYAIGVWKKKGVAFPKTKTGGVCLDEQACKDSGDEILIAHQIYGSASTQMDRVAELLNGCSGLRIHTRFDELKKSGRTGSSKPNIQNRATEPVGDRESFQGGLEVLDVHIKGKLLGNRNILIDMDFDGLELRTVSQSCLDAVGFSRLAEVLNEGEDPHLMVAAQLCKTSYDDAKVRYKQDDPEIVDARGAGKAKMVNFSCWAGTTVKGLRAHAASVGYDYSMDEAADIYKAFMDAWPEAEQYFKWVRGHGGSAGMHAMMCFDSNRYAGLLTYTEACSIISQGRGADATKEGLRALIRECYVGKGLLRGCRLYNFIHDQYQIEIPDDDLAHDRAEYAGKIAREAANIWLPRVPTRAKPMLVRRWSKLAKAVYDKSGRLIPWDITMLDPINKKTGKKEPWPWL